MYIYIYIYICIYTYDSNHKDNTNNILLYMRNVIKHTVGLLTPLIGGPKIEQFKGVIRGNHLSSSTFFLQLLVSLVLYVTKDLCIIRVYILYIYTVYIYIYIYTVYMYIHIHTIQIYIYIYIHTRIVYICITQVFFESDEECSKSWWSLTL